MHTVWKLRPSLTITAALVIACLVTAWPHVSLGVWTPTARELFLYGEFPAPAPGSWTVFNERRAGQPLDLSVRRPTVNLEGTIFGAKYGRPGTRVQANFFHRGRHWIVRVPLEGLQRDIFQVAYFAPRLPLVGYIAGHALHRLEMAEGFPIEIVAPMPTAAELAELASMSEEAAIAVLPEPQQLETVHNVAISAEAQWVIADPGRRYSLPRGVRGAFTNVIRFMAMEERLVDHIRSGHPIWQAEVRVERPDGTTRDIQQVLLKGLDLSERVGISCVYNTISNNCLTTAFEILHEALGLRDQRFGFIRRYFQGRIPTMIGPVIDHFGGVEIMLAHEDPSLERELRAARQRAGALNQVRVCALYFGR